MATGSDRLDELARVLKSLPAKLTAATVQVAEDNAVVLSWPTSSSWSKARQHRHRHHARVHPFHRAGETGEGPTCE